MAGFLPDERDTNHVRIRQALKSLNRKVLEMENENSWQCVSLIERPRILAYERTVSLRLHPEIAQALFDFSKGFQKYELQTAMQFKSVYAMRFYELFSRQKEPVTYRLESLKNMFGVSGKYEKRPQDFIKNIIDAARRELDAKSPYSFTCAPVLEATRTGRGRKGIAAIRFTPVRRPENRDSLLEQTPENRELQKHLPLRAFVEKELAEELKESFGFTEREIRNNLSLLMQAKRKRNPSGRKSQSRRSESAQSKRLSCQSA